MRVLLKGLVILILMANASGAIYGGYSLMADPSGTLLQMPVDYLKNSPFDDYFWPGLILFIVNGLYSLLCIVALISGHSLSRLFVVLQGVLLGGWIVMQMILLQIFYPPLHLTFLAMGALLLLISWLKPEVVSQAKKPGANQA